MANGHFWIGTLGILFYALPMYWAGFLQAAAWNDMTPEGTLANPIFLDTVTQLKTLYMLRALGGLMYIIGAVMMMYNLFMTAKIGNFLAEEEVEAPAMSNQSHKGEHWHRAIERKPVRLMVLSLIVVAIGGLIQIIPTFLVKSNIPTISSVKPYTPLELEGRDIYISEGCYNCHSQMIRPFRSETARYGEYSKAGEFVYDHPFQWGSKRTGPDLAREGRGNKNARPDSWHYLHMLNPADISPNSIMPAYPHLIDDQLDNSLTVAKIQAMRKMGVPYTDEDETNALDNMEKQALEIATNIYNESKLEVDPNTQVIALIAYLQRLGTDINKTEEVQPETTVQK
jgi:cytochrome c oxidase cbb3-type subunit I/II